MYSLYYNGFLLYYNPCPKKRIHTYNCLLIACWFSSGLAAVLGALGAFLSLLVFGCFWGDSLAGERSLPQKESSARAWGCEASGWRGAAGGVGKQAEVNRWAWGHETSGWRGAAGGVCTWAEVNRWAWGHDPPICSWGLIFWRCSNSFLQATCDSNWLLATIFETCWLFFLGAEHFWSSGTCLLGG